ncbi:hypothetical protein N7523_002367 [Penicillium sp. IBT 18751x]|nr:hypothetical protein N7523_002367 [Penicillium sp. IBT 18751x]
MSNEGTFKRGNSTFKAEDELLKNAEEDGDEGDCRSESEGTEVEDEEDLISTTESAALWLGSPPKGLNKLREAAHPEDMRHYGLNCPGPGRVVDGLVLDLISEDQSAMNELRKLFEEAASEQWFPAAKITAEVIKVMESDGKANIPASEMVNIDLKADIFSREVLQIGLADLEGAKVLDCLTKYGEAIIAPSSSHLIAPATWRQMMYKKKVRAFFTHDGTLDAKGVVRSVREIGISKRTIFLSWASWCFDLSLLRDWLEAEGFHNVLPGDQNVCLLFHEFRENVKRVLGTKCYQGRAFPLRLAVLFPLLFGENHELSGRNHHALVDAQRLSLLAKVFIDLCKPPDKRVFWQGSGITKLGSGERQRTMEEFFPQRTHVYGDHGAPGRVAGQAGKALRKERRLENAL